jgi:hypothetical protein
MKKTSVVKKAQMGASVSPKVDKGLKPGKFNPTKKAQKGTTAKKSGPPAAPTSMYKKWSPDRMIAGKDFGKIGSKGAYYYEESGRGKGGIRNADDLPSLDPKRTQGRVERDNEFNRSMVTPRKQLVTQSEYKRYAEGKKATAARNKAAAAAKYGPKKK